MHTFWGAHLFKRVFYILVKHPLSHELAISFIHLQRPFKPTNISLNIKSIYKTLNQTTFKRPSNQSYKYERNFRICAFQFGFFYFIYIFGNFVFISSGQMSSCTGSQKSVPLSDIKIYNFALVLIFGSSCDEHMHIIHGFYMQWMDLIMLRK